MIGTLLDGSYYKILLGNGTAENFISMSYYLKKKSLYGLSTFSFKVSQVGNGASVNILFAIHIIVTIWFHMFRHRYRYNGH